MIVHVLDLTGLVEVFSCIGQFGLLQQGVGANRYAYSFTTPSTRAMRMGMPLEP